MARDREAGRQGGREARLSGSLSGSLPSTADSASHPAKHLPEPIATLAEFCPAPPCPAVMGGIKPPKAKESDDERRYIQRPTGEQFRPPPMKHAGPKRQED